MFSFFWNSPKPSVTEYEFQLLHSFESRKKESTRLLKKYIDSVPIILEKSDQCSMKELSKSQMIVKGALTIGQLITHLRIDLNLSSDVNMYLLINNQKVPTIHQRIEQVYDSYKNKDGFLYITYTNESTFGSP
jgi:GABA(A) receptor-associated protein